VIKKAKAKSCKPKMTKKNGKTTCGKGFYVAYKVPTNLKKVCAKPSSHRKLSVITELASDLK